MKKVLGLFFLLMSCSSYARDGYCRMTVKEVMYERYYSREALEDQLDHIPTEEERQLVAAWLQLELLGAPREAFEKLESSEEWHMRSNKVVQLISRLSVDEDGKASLIVYRECYRSLEAEKRVIPGFDKETKPLLRPDILKRRAGLN